VSILPVSEVVWICEKAEIMLKKHKKVEILLKINKKFMFYKEVGKGTKTASPTSNRQFTPLSCLFRRGVGGEV
jgi:hypothetical protein